MKLDSKTDKQIKRFLKSISESMKISVFYNSIHYNIIKNEQNFHVRFSDHFSKDGRSASEINIVKLHNDFYHFHYFNTTVDIPCEQALEYLKAIILIGPDVLNTINAYVNAAELATKKFNQNSTNALVKRAGERVEELERKLHNSNSELDKVRKQKNQLQAYVNKTHSIHNIMNQLSEIHNLYQTLFIKTNP